MSALPAPSGPDGLGSLLLRHRRMQGRSQQRLAEQLCAVAGVHTVSRHEISRWEREERIPSPYWVVWLSVVLGVETAELERATARTRARRATQRRPQNAGPGTSAWPWRVFTATGVRDAGGRITVQIRPPDPPPPGVTVRPPITPVDAGRPARYRDRVAPARTR